MPGSAPEPCPAAHRVPGRHMQPAVAFGVCFFFSEVHVERLRRAGRAGGAPPFLALHHLDELLRRKSPTSQRLLSEPQCQKPSRNILRSGV